MGFIKTEEDVIREFLADPKMKLNKLVKEKPMNFIGAVGFTLIIVAGFLNQLGLFPHGVLTTFWRFWPVFLFMALAQLIFSKYRFLSILILSLGLGLVIAILVYSGGSVSNRISSFTRSFYLKMGSVIDFLPTSTGELVTEQIVINGFKGGSIPKREINIHLDTGKVKISDTSSFDNLEVNSTYYEKFGRPVVDGSAESKVFKIDVQSEFDLGPLLGGVDELNYNISIGQKNLLTDLLVNIGAGTFNAEFDEMSLENATFDIKTGKSSLKFNQESLPKESLNISIGAGILNIDLPFGVYAKIKHDISSGRLKVNDTPLKGEGTYITPNFRVTTDPYVINIKVGAGDVLINTRN